MDVAVFSDIHGNHAALQACFDYCVGKGITNYVCLGDYISDCPFPQKTMQLVHVLKQYFNTRFIRGNREEYMLSYRKNGATGWMNGSASGALLYTYENLTDDDFNLFHKMPIYGVFEEPGIAKFEYCHGSPTASNEVLIRDKRNTKRVLANLKTDYLVHGHYHVQESYYYRNKRSINPGSVGLPWMHDGKTQFCILHGDGKTWEEENIQLDYDRYSILDEFESSGLLERAPAWSAVTMHTIRTGVDLNETIQLIAMRLCEKETGTCVWPDIPEKYWAEALKMNGIDLTGRPIKELVDKPDRAPVT